MIKGKHHTEETKMKMRGRKTSEETKHKLSEIAKERWKNPEIRKRLIASQIGKRYSEETKKKRDYTKDIIQ